MLKSTFIKEIADFIDGKCTRAECIVDGTLHEFNVRRSIVDDSSIKKHVYLTSKDPLGSVTTFRLLDDKGDIKYEENSIDKVHEKNKGLLLEAKFNLSQVNN